jgi:hypothetical protein
MGHLALTGARLAFPAIRAMLTVLIVPGARTNPAVSVSLASTRARRAGVLGSILHAVPLDPCATGHAAAAAPGIQGSR